MSKKIIIIGAGITGCATACELINRNFDIEIYERSDSIGGVIKDIEYNNENYFNGCHILEESNWLLKVLKNQDQKEFIKTDLFHSSYCNIFDEEILDNEIAHPVYGKDFELNIKKSKKHKNLYECLRYYPEKVSSGLRNWLSQFVDPVRLSSDNAIIFHINRVFFKKRISFVKKLKKNYPIYNNLFGIKKKTDKKFYLPKKGYNSFLEKVEKYLTSNGVKIYKNSPVNIDLQENKFSITSKKNKIDFSHAIWAANPIILMSKLKLEYDNIYINYSIICGIISAKLKVGYNRYFQIYSKDNKIVRIFIYKVGSLPKISVEILNEVISEKNLEFYQVLIEDFLENKLNLPLKLSEINYKNFKRFGYYSDKNIAQLDKMYNYFKNKNFIVDGIHLPGQEQKVNSFLKSFNKNIKNN